MGDEGSSSAFSSTWGRPEAEEGTGQRAARIAVRSLRLSERRAVRDGRPGSRPMIRAHEVLQVLWFFVPAYLANMSPVLVQGWFQRLAAPIDGGRSFRGKRIHGDHNTWRGLLVGIVVGTRHLRAATTLSMRRDSLPALRCSTMPTIRCSGIPHGSRDRRRRCGQVVLQAPCRHRAGRELAGLRSARLLRRRVRSYRALTAAGLRTLGYVHRTRRRQRGAATGWPSALKEYGYDLRRFPGQGDDELPRVDHVPSSVRARR